MNGNATREGNGPQDRLSPDEALRLYRPDVAARLADLRAPRFRYQQVYAHLMRRPAVPLSQCTSLPAALRAELEPIVAREARLEERIDDDAQTSRLVIGLADGLRIETVIMRYLGRTTVCISSQVGCPVGCAFCATGDLGFERNLSTGEILDQMRLCAALLETEGRRVTNVVFMGMGEPLLNRAPLFSALQLLRDPQGLHVRTRGVSVSTVGVPEGIVELARKHPQVNLALSLHAPSNELRDRLLPINRRYRLEQVLEATDTHFALTHRKLLVEYVLLGGVNDSPAHAVALANLLKGRVAAVNLIPWNRTGGPFRAPSSDSVTTFRDKLKQHHIDVAVRVSRGADIRAACGQLVADRATPTLGGACPWHDRLNGNEPPARRGKP